MEKLIQILKSLPAWARAVVISILAIAAGIAMFFSTTSCSMVRASLDGDGRLSTSVNQSVADSVNISVYFNR